MYYKYDFAKLTPRERDVIEALIRYGIQKIAAPHLRMSVQTIKNHTMKILQKTEAANMLQVCAMYAIWKERKRHGNS